MITISGLSSLTEWLQANLGGARLVTIDGFSKAGKGGLGRHLEASLGFTWIDLDPYLDQHRNGFVEALRFDDFTAAIDAAPTPAALTGTCMLAALKRVGRKADMSIYVQRLDEFGRWEHDDFEDDALERFDQSLLARGFDPGDSTLDYEERDYHRKYRPHEVADVLFHPDY